MSFAQRVLKFFLPARWFQAIEADSRRWFIVCKTCGFKKNVWELGGVRYKAASAGRVSYLNCPKCMQRRWFGYEKI